MGFTACEIGNPDLKPNFVFKHSESEAFQQLKMYNHKIKQAVESLQSSLNNKTKSDE